MSVRILFGASLKFQLPHSRTMMKGALADKNSRQMSTAMVRSATVGKLLDKKRCDTWLVMVKLLLLCSSWVHRKRTSFYVQLAEPDPARLQFWAWGTQPSDWDTLLLWSLYLRVAESGNCILMHADS